MMRIFRNIFFYFKGIKKIRESKDSIYFKCLKCKSEIRAFKYYGILHINCRCGHSADVYTGKDNHFHSDSKPIKKDIVTHNITDLERATIKFKKHIKNDLNALFNLLHDKRNVTKQVTIMDCDTVLTNKPLKSAFEDMVKYLSNFCNLSSMNIHVVWEPLTATRLLDNIDKSIDILGTTYVIPMGSTIYYSIYLNPKFLDEKKKILAVISHELSHVYASVKNINFVSPDEDRGNKEYDEQMTDLLGIALGLGKIMCYESEDKESYNTGYLTNKMVCSANNIWENTFLSGKTKNLTTITNCNNCFQKLRIPIKKGNLNLICPKCDTKFTYKY